jgi:hypothetical protein
VAKFNVRSPREAAVCKDGAEVLRNLFEAPLKARKDATRFEQLYSDSTHMSTEQDKSSVVKAAPLALQTYAGSRPQTAASAKGSGARLLPQNITNTKTS